VAVCGCRKSEEELRKVMKTVSDSFAECSGGSPLHGSPDGGGGGGGGGLAPPPPPPVMTRSSSSMALSEDSSSDLMEHFMSELDLVFSDILAEEVSPPATSLSSSSSSCLFVV